jgi:hypothetical protein
VTEKRTPYPVRVDGRLDPPLSRGPAAGAALALAGALLVAVGAHRAQQRPTAGGVAGGGGGGGPQIPGARMAPAEDSLWTGDRS